MLRVKQLAGRAQLVGLEFSVFVEVIELAASVHQVNVLDGGDFRNEHSSIDGFGEQDCSILNIKMTMEELEAKFVDDAVGPKDTSIDDRSGLLIQKFLPNLDIWDLLKLQRICSSCDWNISLYLCTFAAVKARDAP